MTRPDEIVRLLESMKESVSGTRKESRRTGLLDLEPYKSNQAWPGRRYSLVGNSYCVETRLIHGNQELKRTACIAVVLERGRQNRKCVSVEDALDYPGFRECLSRFELDWLGRQPASTLIGPAYDPAGHLVPHAFAVWRRHQDKPAAGREHDRCSEVSLAKP